MFKFKLLESIKIVLIMIESILHMDIADQSRITTPEPVVTKHIQNLKRLEINNNRMISDQ